MRRLGAAVLILVAGILGFHGAAWGESPESRRWWDRSELEYRLEQLERLERRREEREIKAQELRELREERAEDADRERRRRLRERE